MSRDKKQTIRAILVDDEELARRYLSELLQAHPQVEVLAQCPNGFEAVRACADHKPDLVFLDVRMPKLDGFEVLELIDSAIQVIFVTAYDQYALKAFEVHALDYLLKPFSPARLAEALARVRVGVARNPDQARQVQEAARAPQEFIRRVVIRDGSSVVVIPVAELEYVEAQDDYIAVHAGGRSHLKHQTLTGLAQNLDPAQFVRIHRSALINIDLLDRLEPYTKDSKVAILSDGTRLPVSRSGYARLREVLDSQS